MRKFNKDKLIVEIFSSRIEMGKRAAFDISNAVNTVLDGKSFCNIIFAAAPSQYEVLKALIASSNIDWTRINAFHMDEYIGLSKSAPQCFSNFLRNMIFDKVPFHSVNCINSETNVNDEILRYSALIKENPPDIVIMGIGENGHLAFNDPSVADFADKEIMKTVSLEQTCRMQQVHDGCFSSLEDVPVKAVTLTIPVLMSCRYGFCIVPAATKAGAVAETLEGAVSERCPASILRTHGNCILYLDEASASKLAYKGE